jgi:two-component system sensor histidine kinase/response regulator
MKRLMEALERQSLKTKLVIGLSVLLAVSALLAINALYTQRSLNEELQRMYENEVVGVSAIKETHLQFSYISRAIRQFVLAANGEERARSLAQLQEAEAAMRRNLEKTTNLLYREENRKRISDFRDRFALYRAYIDKVIALVQKGQVEEARMFIGSAEFQREGVTANELLDQIAQVKEQGARVEAEKYAEMARRGGTFTMILIVLGGGFGVVSGLLISISIRKPTEKLRASVEALAAGKLDSVLPHLDYRNETGEMARAIAVLQR